MVPTTSFSASLMTRTLTFQGSILRSEIDTTFENLNNRLLNSPDEIVWITVANVTDANRASHLELREKLFNIMLQSPYVKVVEFSFPKVLISLSGFLQIQCLAWRGRDPRVRQLSDGVVDLHVGQQGGSGQVHRLPRHRLQPVHQLLLGHIHLLCLCCFRYKVGIRILPTFCCNLRANVQTNVMNFTCNSHGRGAWIST